MKFAEGQLQRARWTVMWVYLQKGKKKLARKDFGEDFEGALQLYVKAEKAGKLGATLVCVNMGWPPPPNLQRRTVKKRGRSKLTGKIKTVKVEVDPLRELNMQGKVYCPYCRKLRPFIRRSSFRIYGVTVNKLQYVCPICSISHENYWVRMFNPTASIHMTSSLAPRTRTPRKKR